MGNNSKILVITSKHRAQDARIYQKQVKSLSERYDVGFIHTDERNQEMDRYEPKKGFYRRMMKLIRRQRPGLVMLHDLDMILIFGLLRIFFPKTKFVVDIHEDYPLQIQYKPYLKFGSRKVMGALLKRSFPWLLTRFDGVLYATDFIFEKYEKVVKAEQMALRNYPKLQVFRHNTNDAKREIDLLYIGGISIKRGMDHMATLAKLETFNVTIAGPVKDAPSMALLEQLKPLRNFKYLGLLPYEEAIALVHRSKIGLVPLHPTENYLTSAPVKMFEYLAGGCHVLASDFPYWIEKYGHLDGLTFVNFANSEHAQAKVQALLTEPALNQFEDLSMAYDWEAESDRLHQFVKKITD